MADIQYLLTGISGKEPKSINELNDELRKLELLEYKRRTDPMALASIDRRRKKVLAWIDQAETRQRMGLDEELRKVTSSVTAAYDEDEPEEGESEEHEAKETPSKESAEHEDSDWSKHPEEYETDHEEYDYDEDEEIELMRAALTTSDATHEILEKLLNMHDAEPEDTNEKVEEIYSDEDFIPDMSSGVDLRASSGSNSLRRFASAVLRKQSQSFGGEDLEDSGARVGRDLENDADDWEDERSAQEGLHQDEDRNTRETELLRRVLGRDTPDLARQIEMRLRNQGLLRTPSPDRAYMSGMINPKDRYNEDMSMYASRRSKFSKEAGRLEDLAREEAMRDMAEEGFMDEGLEEEGEGYEALPGLAHHRKEPRYLTREEVDELVRDSQRRRQLQLEQEKSRSMGEVGRLHGLEEERRLTGAPPNEKAEGFLRSLQELTPEQEERARWATTINRLVKKAQWDEETLKRQHNMAMMSPTQNFVLGGDYDPDPGDTYDEEPESENHDDAQAYLYGEISDAEFAPIARIIASEWHDGQWSGLYSFSSTGEVHTQSLKDDAILSIEKAMEHPSTKDTTELEALKRYIEKQVPLESEDEDEDPLEGHREFDSPDNASMATADHDNPFSTLEASLSRGNRIKTANDYYFENYKVEF